MGRLSAISSAVALFLSLLPGWAGAAPAMWLVRDADTEIYLFGALHMVGEDGLPTLLAARRYEVRRIQ